jgi:hypothetical protein
LWYNYSIKSRKQSEMNKLSKTSKLDNILSWSLQALETCPGSLSAAGVLVDACSGCYATTGCYSFKGTKAVRADNKAAWQEAGWVDTMVAALKKQSFFRWFDSGDMYSLSLAVKMYEVMAATPHVKHWLPTRMYKFAKFEAILARMEALPNVMVRRSSDAVDGTFTKGVHGSTIIPAGAMAAVLAILKRFQWLHILLTAAKWQRLFGWLWLQRKRQRKRLRFSLLSP